MDQAPTSWGWGLPEQEIGHDPDHRERPDHDHPGDARRGVPVGSVDRPRNERELEQHEQDCGRHGPFEIQRVRLDVGSCFLGMGR